MSASLSIEARLTRIEEHLGIDPEPETPTAPPAMAMPQPDPQRAALSPAQQLEQRIELLRIDLAGWNAKIERWQAGNDPEFPKGAPYRPCYQAQAELCERNIADLEQHLIRTTGRARPLAQRR